MRDREDKYFIVGDEVLDDQGAGVGHQGVEIGRRRLQAAPLLELGQTRVEARLLIRPSGDQRHELLPQPIEASLVRFLGVAFRA